MGYRPIPAATTTLCRYVSFLAKKLKYNSIKQYLNYVRIRHCERNLPNPLENNFLLTHTMKGICRCLGDTVVRKKPVTPDMLKCIIKNLDLKKPFDAAIWALCLTLFYGFLRRSNVMAPSWTKFDGSKHLRRQDILFYSWDLWCSFAPPFWQCVMPSERFNKFSTTQQWGRPFRPRLCLSCELTTQTNDFWDFYWPRSWMLIFRSCQSIGHSYSFFQARCCLVFTPFGTFCGFYKTNGRLAIRMLCQLYRQQCHYSPRVNK